jgi:hypothetical protein
MSKEYRYKKSPERIVKAEQFIPGTRIPEGMKPWGSVEERAEWKARDMSFGYVNAPTPVGWQDVCANDWIITGSEGSHQRLDNDVFHELYEPIETEGHFERFGVDLEVAVVRTKDFMLRLLSSGIDPSYVSLEGFRYAKDILAAYNIKLPHESLRGDVASVIIEEATMRAGIHSDQLRAVREWKG